MRTEVGRRITGLVLATSLTVMVLVTMTVTASPVGAITQSWHVQSIPKPAGSTNSVLNGVSCPSATACMAVGGYDANASSMGVTLAERWNGSAWAVQPTPIRRGSIGSGLAGVSCTSATACEAVGAYEDSSHADFTLAERWNGSAWHLQPTPNRAGSTGSDLTSVSCPSATACTAVGYYTNAKNVQATLAETWNGSAWSVQTTPYPLGLAGGHQS